MVGHVIQTVLALLVFAVLTTVFGEAWRRFRALADDAHVVDFLIMTVVLVVSLVIAVAAGNGLVPHVTALLP